MSAIIARLTVIMSFIFALSACETKTTDDQASDALNNPDTLPQKKPEFFYVDSDALFIIGSEQFDVAISENKKLVKKIKAFTIEPSEERLAQAQNQWQDTEKAHIKLSYFYHLARSSPDTFNKLDRLQFRIAARPIQPGFIDSFGEYKYSGLVHDIGFALNEKKLEEQHGLTDPEEVVLGLYAIQFLLLGQSGDRTASDFEIKVSIPKKLAEQGIKSTTELASNRRRNLLSLQTSLLEKDMLSLATLWQKGSSDSLITKFKALDTAEQNRIFGQAYVNLLTETLIDLAELANRSKATSTNKNDENLGNKRDTRNENSDNMYSATILKIESAKKFVPTIVNENKASSQIELLNASQTALTTAKENKNASSTTANKGENPLSVQLTAAYQQLKLAIDQTQ